jgi:HsdM-like protein/N-6 DNA methylase
VTDIIQKLWGFCHTLRHEGIDYGDYIEQLTYLLFLKMADERAIQLPKGCDWPLLVGKSGTALRDHYIDVLRTLGLQRGILGDIFAGAQSRFNDPVSLKRLLGLIDETEWTALDVDVKAAAFEGLLEKAASEGKKGAGQYFTPRILIKAIVRCMKPNPRRLITPSLVTGPAIGATAAGIGNAIGQLAAGGQFSPGNVLGAALAGGIGGLAGAGVGVAGAAGWAPDVAAGSIELPLDIITDAIWPRGSGGGVGGSKGGGGGIRPTRPSGFPGNGGAGGGGGAGFGPPHTGRGVNGGLAGRKT